MKKLFIFSLSMCFSTSLHAIDYRSNSQESGMVFSNPAIERILSRDDLSTFDPWGEWISLKEKCTSNVLNSFSVPYDYKESNAPAKKVILYYQHEIVDNDLPTVIYIPGGPGLSSVGQKILSIENFSRILIEPRKVGCNFSDDPLLPQSSSFEAQDILALIKQLRLKNYIIYAQSFGTAVATKLGYYLNQQSVADQPKAIVLEGTVGLGDPTENRWFLNHIKVIEKLFARYPGVRDSLTNHRFDLSDEEFGSFLVDNIGSDPNIITNLAALIQKWEIAQTDRDSLAEEIKEIVLDVFPIIYSKIGGQIEAFEEIYCREFGKLSIDSAAFSEAGEWTITNGNQLCKQIPMDRKYIPGDFQITAPIYYIQGEFDPQTIMEDAVHHYNNQTTTKFKEMLVIPEGGHVPSRRKKQFSSCMFLFWQRVTAGKSVMDLLNHECRKDIQ